MEFNYLKFKLEYAENNEPKSGWFSTLLTNVTVAILKLVVPRANPDFDDQLPNVKTWLIEIHDEGIPEREIGLDKNNRVLVIAPWKNNFGYWTDNQLELKDFIKSFEVSPISEDEFNNLWDEYDGTPA